MVIDGDKRLSGSTSLLAGPRLWLNGSSERAWGKPKWSVPQQSKINLFATFKPFPGFPVMIGENTVQLPPEASSPAHIKVLGDLRDRLAAMCETPQQPCGACVRKDSCSEMTTQTIEAMLRVGHDCEMALAREQRAQQTDAAINTIDRLWIRGVLDDLSYLLLSNEVKEPAKLIQRSIASVPASYPHRKL